MALALTGSRGVFQAAGEREVGEKSGTVSDFTS